MYQYCTSSCAPPKFLLFEGCKSWITDCSRVRTCYRLLLIGNLICQSRARYLHFIHYYSRPYRLYVELQSRVVRRADSIVRCSTASEGSLILLQICHCLQSPSMYEKAEIICGPRPSRHSSKLFVSDFYSYLNAFVQYQYYLAYCA